MTSLKYATLIAAALLVSPGLPACASKDRDRLRPGSGSSAFAGIKVATPDALILSSFASQVGGAVSLDAVPAGAEALLDRYDADGSGSLSAAEFSGFAGAELGDPYGRPGMHMFDRDGSMGVSRDEFVSGWLDIAARYDRDGDRQVTRAEMLKSLPQGRGRESGGERSGNSGGRGGERGGRGGGRGRG